MITVFESYVDIKNKWNSLWSKLKTINQQTFNTVLTEFDLEAEKLSEYPNKLNPKKLAEIIQKLMYYLDQVDNYSYKEKPLSDDDDFNNPNV